MESEEIEHVILTTWPRLYLDTGDIIDIADGKADCGVVNELTSVAYERGLILVVGQAHFQDTLRIDEESRNRVSDALEKFQLRAYVANGPAEIELGPTTRGDITLKIAGNIRELNEASASAASIQTAQLAQQKLPQALVLYQQARTRETRQVSLQVVELAVQCTVSLIDGWPSEDASTVLEFWREKKTVEIEVWERATLLDQLKPFASLLSEVAQMPGLPETWRATTLEAYRASAISGPDTQTPGQYLAGRLTSSNMLNTDRRPKPSDLLDTSHVAHLPYVDVATCDRAAFAAVSRHVRREYPRPVQLFRNGQLCNVLEAIRHLPNARQALTERMLCE